jgi:hypothetical protein
MDDSFTFHQIALTAMVAAVAAYTALRLAARELRERDDVAIGLHVGVATFVLRWFANIPALNDDFMALVSPNDVLGFPIAAAAGLVYWAYWPFGGPRLSANCAWRCGLLLGLVGFGVNVVCI